MQSPDTGWLAEYKAIPEKLERFCKDSQEVSPDDDITGTILHGQDQGICFKTGMSVKGTE